MKTDSIKEAVAEDAPHQTQQEWVYQQLRKALIRGQFVPGKSITMRGVAKMLDVGVMPAREALRRLVAERALEMLNNRRVSVPQMTAEKLEELCEARVALETIAALRALPFINQERLEQLRVIDNEVDQAIDAEDMDTFLQKSWDFHATFYSFGNSQILLPLIESLWLQFGPFMRLVLTKIGSSYLVDWHKQALEAIERKDSLGLKLAIERDIRDGLGALGKEELQSYFQES